ncbi:MAG: glycosyltransferase [Methylococcaceae bacterium]
MPIKSIALFSPGVSSHETTMLNGLAGGFRSMGLETHVMTRLLPSQMLRSFCLHKQVDAVFEINRFRNEVPNLPEKTVHIAWIQDPVNEIRSVPSCSQMTYYLCDPDILGYTISEAFQSTLYVGYDQTRLAEFDEDYRYDFSLIGYMPEPLPDVSMAYLPFCNSDVSIGELFTKFTNQYASDGLVQDFQYCEAVLARILDCDYGQSFADLKLSKERFMDVFYTYGCRSLGRSLVLKKAIDISKNMAIYGGKEWALWEQFSPYYQGYLSEPLDIEKVYQQTRLNLHFNPNGVGLHSRVIDCMGNASVVMVNSSQFEGRAGSISTEFVPYEHYLPYDLGNFNEVVDTYLQDEEALMRIGRQANQEIQQKHTWSHRAQQIMNDLKSL